MFIFIWIALAITNNMTPVPEWLLMGVGIAALIEGAYCLWHYRHYDG